MLDLHISLVLVETRTGKVAGQVLAESEDGHSWKCLGYGRKFLVSKTDPGYRVEKIA